MDAIEWTPQAGIEGGGHPRWFDMYRRILAAGKSLQIVNVSHDELIPLLDAIGGKGVNVMTTFADDREADAIMRQVECYR